MQSRRLLHSSFWCHGAGDIDLPSWWMSLLQLPSPLDGTHPPAKPTGSRDALGSEGEGSLFEFLYPAQTLALIRRLSSYNFQGRWRRQRYRNGIRSYTSRAAETEDESMQENDLLGDSFSPGLAGVNEGPQEGVPEDEHIRTFDDILRTSKRKEYQAAWRSFRMLVDTEGEESLTYQAEALLDYLSTSERSIDAERTIELLSQFYSQKWGPPQYRIAIQAWLRLSNLDKATETHREALSKVAGDVGTSTLLASALARKEWDVASRAWHDFRQRSYRSATQEGVWEQVDTLPDLIELSLSLADYTQGLMQMDEVAPTADGLGPSNQFVNTVLFRAFDFKSAHITRKRVHQLFDRLEEFGLLGKNNYENAMHRLLNLNRGGIAGSVYRDYRQREGYMPNQKLLYRLLSVFCKSASLDDIRLVVDDAFAAHGGLDRQAYQAAIGKLASLGDADSVHKLFGRFVSQHGVPKDVTLLRPLLLVHARRAEVDETARQFRRVSEQFGITPDLQCWNILISVYARVSDVDGAFQCFNDMLRTNLEADEYTYSILFNLCARMGDATLLHELLRITTSGGTKRSLAATESLVLACINNDELDEAERIAEAALSMEFHGPRTRMWNYLLNAHSLRRNIEAVTRLHQRMQKTGVPLDGMTYAALMQSLAILKETDAAYKILRVVMPRDGIKATAFHYAIVMGGFVSTNETWKVFRVYKHMVKRNIRPTLSTQIPLLKASVSAEGTDTGEAGVTEAIRELTQTEDLLEETLASLDPMDFASREPVRGINKEPLDDAYLAAPFEFLIFIYGQQGLFEKVQQLYERYLETADERKLKAKVTPTIKLLSALMVSHFRQQQYSEVYKCWDLAKSSTERVSKRLGATDLLRPGWVLPSQRFRLATPLMYLMKALGAQRDLDGIARIIAELQSDGYNLDSRNWNLYVQLLVRNGRVLEAFQCCEEKLMDGWRGWPSQRRQQGLSKAVAKTALTNKIQPWLLAPRYPTFVYLAAAILDIQAAESGSLSSLDKTSASEKIIKIAPRTMEAVRNLPRVDDALQTDLLRRW